MASDGWVAVIASGELPANRLTRVEVGEDPALLYRLGDAISYEAREVDGQVEVRPRSS